MSEYLTPDDTRDALRKLGGILLGLGVLMLLQRKGNDIAAFWQFLLFAGPAVLLYGGGVLTISETGGLRPWQAVYSVFGLLFIPLALFQFIDLIGGTPGTSLNVAWVLAATAAAAVYAGVNAGVRFHLLAGSLVAVGAWLALWNEILSDGLTADIGTFRGLLAIAAIGLLAGALYLWRTDTGESGTDATALQAGGDQGLWKASEILTAAGIVAVIACSLAAFIGAASSIASAVTPFGTPADTGIDTNWFWDISLLISSLALVGIGAQLGVRGPVYVGAFGLVLFLIIVGSDLGDESPAPNDLGVWPIILLALGALGIALSSVKEASQGDKPAQFVKKLRGR